MDSIVEILRQTMPLQVAGDDLLRKIARRRPACLLRAGRGPLRGRRRPRTTSTSSSRAESSTRSSRASHARLSTQILKKGDVFGWAALLEKTPRRLARRCASEPTEIVRIGGDELLRCAGRPIPTSATS